jgi:hypothetical protein
MKTAYGHLPFAFVTNLARRPGVRGPLGGHHPAGLRSDVSRPALPSEAGARATVSIAAHSSGDGENGDAQGERPSVVVRSATAMPAPSDDAQ